MYPADDLAALQREKLLRVQRSAELRGDIASACATLAYPVSVVERAIATLKKIVPFLPIATALFRGRTDPISSSSGKKGLFGTILRWAPTVLNAAKIFRSSRQTTTT